MAPSPLTTDLGMASMESAQAEGCDDQFFLDLIAKHRELIQDAMASRLSRVPDDRDFVVLMVVHEGVAVISTNDREYAIQSMQAYESLGPLVRSLRNPPSLEPGAGCLVHLAVVAGRRTFCQAIHGYVTTTDGGSA